MKSTLSHVSIGIVLIAILTAFVSPHHLVWVLTLTLGPLLGIFIHAVFEDTHLKGS